MMEIKTGAAHAGCHGILGSLDDSELESLYVYLKGNEEAREKALIKATQEAERREAQGARMAAYFREYQEKLAKVNRDVDAVTEKIGEM
ncbi:MAG: hypothetical protein HFI88_10105 [Lachnospiraceae bacterium]|nr:hypothetical protein [Lachnospiraceae bacterium]